jgi:uncharacterized protein YybS (DUF2232 family)
MRQSSSLPLVSVVKAVAGTVIIAALMLIVPLAPVVLAPFLALPVAYVVAQRGWVGGAAVAVVAPLLLYFGAGIGVALLVFLVIVSMGMTLGWALRSGWRFPRSLDAMAISLLVALVVYGVVLWLAFGLSLTELKQTANDSITNAGQLYGGMGASSATVAAMSGQLRKLVDIFPYLAPGFIGTAVVLVTACTLGLAYVLFPRLRQRVAVTMSLSTFRMHWAVAYVSIVGLAMLLFSRGGAHWHSVLLYAGIDVLLVSQTLFFLQALGVLRWFGANRRWQPGSRTLLFISAVLAQAFFQLTGLVGLLDTWIDYRKRFALKSPGPGPLR